MYIQIQTMYITYSVCINCEILHVAQHYSVDAMQWWARDLSNFNAKWRAWLHHCAACFHMQRLNHAVWHTFLEWP